MATVADEISALLIDLDDPNQRYFDDDALITWINQAQMDIARRAECLLQTNNVDIDVDVSVVTAPEDTLRIHEVTFSPNDPMQIYPLQYSGRQEMNNIWYVNQLTSGSYPIFYTTWGQPPEISVQVFPVPSQAGQLAFWYYRMPVVVAETTDTLDIPMGWEDCLRAFVRYMARRKSGDPIWQDDRGLYEDMLGDLITSSRNWTDAAGNFTMGGAYIPGWLYGGWGS